MRIRTCPCCGVEALRRVRRPVTFTVRGKPTTIPDVPRLRCSACAEEFFDRESNLVLESRLGARRSRGAA